MIPGTNVTSTSCHLFSFGLKDVWRRGQDATVAPPQQCDVALCELENVVHFSSKACISCAPLLSHTTTHSSSPSASIYSWWLPPGGSSHQQGRTGGLSAGQRINNLGPSARRINNPVAVARIINPAHGRDNCANPALQSLGQSFPLEDSRHSITGWNCAGDRCRGPLCLVTGTSLWRY